MLSLVSALSNALTAELLQSGKANVKPTEKAIAAPAVLANALCLLLASGLTDTTIVSINFLAELGEEAQCDVVQFRRIPQCAKECCVVCGPVLCS